MTIRIVTDSTCDLPESAAAAHGITVVPAYINIDGHSYLDGLELSRQAFYEGLPGYRTSPTTAAPAVGAFTQVYDQLAAEGATGVLSIHLSSKLSGVLNAARLGAEATQIVPVKLFDSQQLTMGLGLLAMAAAEAAAAGRSMAEIARLLEERVARTYVFAALDTLEYLWRSGRVSRAQFGLGTLLKIKPLLRVYCSEVEMMEKVRTSRRAVERMIELVEALGPLEHLALLHTHAAGKLDEFREQTRHLFPAGSNPLAVEVTPAIGAHVGPGGLGLACIVAT
ncbi:MAG: DegV family protein [Chloroflexi bacterium]|nr:DegV family protein [Chloroflexota bacterium]